MFLILIISVLAIGGILYKLGGNVYNKSRGELELKYHSLVSHLLSTHDRIRIIEKTNNLLVIGVVSMGGKTLFTIKERPKEGGGDEVSITYSIKDNPTTNDFDLRFVFSEQQCISEPEFVLRKINQRINQYISTHNI
jgi:hypothetical protein